MAHASRAPSRLRFAFVGGSAFLEIPREDGLDFLEWLGLGRGEFGALAASELRARCQRRLWPERRNLAPFLVRRPDGARTRETGTLRDFAVEVSRVLTDAPSAIVHFG